MTIINCFKKTYPLMLLAAGACTSMAVGCGGSATPAVQSKADEPSTWTKRSLWTEKKGDQTLVFIVGRASNASLDQSMAMDNAEQDAREKLAIYLAGTVKAFRERLSMLTSVKGKRGEVGSGDKPGAAAELTEKDERGGRTVADAAVRGVEVVNSTLDKDSDTQLVLAQLDMEKFRSVLSKATALSDAERARVDENSAEVREAMDKALEDAKASSK